MTAVFMLYATAVGAALALAGDLLERMTAWHRAGRRWAWLISLAALLALAAVAPWRGHSARAHPANTAAPASDARAAADARWPWSIVNTRMMTWTGALATAMAPVDRSAQVLWIVVSLVLFTSAAGGRWRLARRRRTWSEATVNGVAVLVAADAVPAVVGLLQPRIVVPAWACDADAHQRALLLRHEQEHLRARDPWLVHAAAAAVVLMPWNPAVWWMAARLRLAVELDCDARVLGPFADRSSDQNADVAAYGELLIAVAARVTSRASALTVALLERRSSLERRITVMSAPAPHVTRPRAVLVGLAIVAASVVAVAVPTPTLLAEQSRDIVYDAQTPGVTNPVVLTEVQPRYPAEAKRRKIQGLVVLNGIVDAQGHLQDIKVAKSPDPNFGLDAAATAAANRWAFKPGRRDGRAVPVRVTMEFRFSLKN